MTARRAITKRDVLTIVLAQEGKCRLCALKLKAGEIHFDHIMPLAIGGIDEMGNLQALCIPCHKEKTNGRGATTYGSDKGNIKKDRHLRRGPKPPSGKFPKGKKLQSRNSFKSHTGER